VACSARSVIDQDGGTTEIGSAVQILSSSS